ncbi:hypothetical protein ISCGN_019864 [Ixodes scapularis]
MAGHKSASQSGKARNVAAISKPSSLGACLVIKVWASRTSKMACQLSKAALLPLVPWCSYAGALTCVTLAVASSGFHNSGVFINPQDIAPLHAGSVFGLMNTVGAIPGVVGVYLVGYVVDATRSWALIFHTTALLNVLGCGFFLAFGRGHPVLS